MSVTTRPTPQAGGGQTGFQQLRTLPRSILVALAVVASGIGVLFIALTPVNDIWTFVIVTVLVYAVLAGIAAVAYEGGRRSKDRIATTLVWGAFAIAVTPLVLVLGYTTWRGLARLDIEFFTSSMRNIGATDDGGGAWHAIIGTLQQVALTALMAVPIGILTAIYIVEYGRGRLATVIRYFVDVMTGVPSIVAGLFIYAFWVIGLGRGFSGFAAALALTILMLPTVVRATEEMLNLVPDALRESSYALGVPKWKTIVRIVLPTAATGIVTGVMLAVARVAGETAPLLLTSFGNPSINSNPFVGAQSSLPEFVYKQAADPQQTAIDRAWTGALTLIILVMALNVLARWVASRSDLSRSK